MQQEIMSTIVSIYNNASQQDWICLEHSTKSGDIFCGHDWWMVEF